MFELGRIFRTMLPKRLPQQNSFQLFCRTYLCRKYEYFYHTINN